MSNLENWAADKGIVVKPNKMAGEMLESKDFSRNFKDTWRLSSVSLCWVNFIHAMWLLCFTSTVALVPKSPGKFFPKYLCVSWPCTIISPPTSRNIRCVKAVVVKIFVFDVFRCVPQQTILRWVSPSQKLIHHNALQTTSSHPHTSEN